MWYCKGGKIKMKKIKLGLREYYALATYMCDINCF